MNRRQGGLQFKLVTLLLAVGLIPALVAAVLIERIAEVAQSFASNEVERLAPRLERSADAYRELIEQTKATHRQIAARVASNPDILGDAELESVGLIEARRGEEIVYSGRALGADERAVELESSDWVFTFAVELEPMRELLAIDEALRAGRRVQTVRESLPSSYRTAFILVVGGFALVLIALGVVLGRRVTRRIDELEAGFREVAAGEMSVRIDASGQGELAEMARAFNRMVADLEAERRKSTYLQRIGTWQDVARKLAHEIKNPLTPIRLAVQQVRSSYKGDDERFRRLLGDADEIVAEEIENLRRLVDAFRELGRLPRVEAAPLALAQVLADLQKDPEIAAHLDLRAPAEPVEVQADRLLLRRVLHNLIENGIQSGGKGAKVTVSWAETEDGRAQIVIDDNGPGVEASMRDALFEPYVTSKETGTGLGLAIAKKIAIEHGGTLELEDEPSPLGGARFVLTVPTAAA